MMMVVDEGVSSELNQIILITARFHTSSSTYQYLVGDRYSKNISDLFEITYIWVTDLGNIWNVYHV